MAGAPAHWRTSDSDADRNPEFVDIWMNCFDAISPWTVGRYSDETSANRFAEDRIQGDVDFIDRWATTRGKHVDYVPVVHPGGSVCRPAVGWVKADEPTHKGLQLVSPIMAAKWCTARRWEFFMEADIQRSPLGCTNHVWRDVGRI
jgi:hypothetical protein